MNKDFHRKFDEMELIFFLVLRWHSIKSRSVILKATRFMKIVIHLKCAFNFSLNFFQNSFPCNTYLEIYTRCAEKYIGVLLKMSDSHLNLNSVPVIVRLSN
jgi:hypothetical protein